jgi:L-histidine Nalpha-methyltransferase
MTPTSGLPHFVQIHRTDTAAVRAELAAGLLSQQPQVAPKFFYDALGSRLFDAITELTEYYPTRTEAAIFREHGAAMAQCVPPSAVLIDLGAGSCAKAAGLFPVLRPAAYVAVDISVDYLRGALGELQQRHRAVPMLGLGMDFSTGLSLPVPAADWLERHDLFAAPRCVFYPGSSIGNFNRTEALALLRQARALCAAGGPGGGLLIGVDRVKDKAILEPAYDDPLGVTAAFNRNLLLHTNALLGSDFAPRALAARGLLQRGRLAHRDAPAVGRRADRALAGRRTPLCRWGPGAHRELLQVATGRLRRAAARSGLRPVHPLDRSARLVRCFLGTRILKGMAAVPFFNRETCS